MGAKRTSTRIPRRGRAALAVAVCAIGAAALGGGTTAAQGPSAPNVVLVMSDDQHAASLELMSSVSSRIGAKGAAFPDSFTNWPLCCPSRATYLTGQYAINHGVRGNSPPGGGYAKFEELHGTNNLAVWMRDAGYYTAHVGKYLNGYAQVAEPTEVPFGWDEWYVPPSATQAVYCYQLNENGVLTDHGTEEADFKGDVLTDRAVGFIESRAPEAQPFFLSVGYTAPHAGGPESNPRPPADCQGTTKPAPRHATAFDTEPLPAPDSFNEADVSDKPAAIQALAPLAQEDVDDLTRRYRCRIESLLHVDEGVDQMLDALRAAGELRDTIFIYTADNGFFHGEHRVKGGKNRAYEEAIRVPLVMRGPGVPKGVRVREPAINADLAATILDAAGAEPAGHPLDGRSLLPLASDPRHRSGRELLLEKGAANDEGEPDNDTDFFGIRNERFKYVEYGNGETELYDVRADPFELQSLHADPAYDEVRLALAARLDALVSCDGSTCLTAPTLELELDYEPGPGKCAERPVTAGVTGADEGSLTRVAFEVNGEDAGERLEAPFSKRMPYGLLNDRPRSRVHATADLIDGRTADYDARVETC